MSYEGQFTVEYSADDVTYTNISTYVVNASLTRGRQKITDRYTPDFVNVELLAPLTSGPAIPPVRYYLRIKNNNVSVGFLFKGIITDVQRNYGIPYTAATGKAPADRITISAASLGMYFAGRGYANAVSIAAGTTIKAAVDAVVLAGCGSSVTVGSLDSGTPFFTAWPAQGETYSGLAADYINTSLQATVSRLSDRPGLGATMLMLEGDYVFSNSFNFTDGTVSTTGWTTILPYDTIDFLASNDNSYTQVRMAYNVSSTATSQSGSAPYATYQVTSNTQTLDKAQSASDYTLAVVSQTQYRPFSISTKVSMLVAPGPFAELLTGNILIGSEVRIGFRGTTYYLILEGYTITEDLDDARYTFYFSPSLGQALILDSAVWGILNTNTLGIG